jgi:hypothetical protein
VAGCCIQEIIYFLDIFPVIALVTRQSKIPFFQNRIPFVP